MKIAVIDGQGGGIGKYIIQRLREEFKSSLEIIALGTNALATANMLKAGANDCCQRRECHHFHDFPGGYYRRFGGDPCGQCVFGRADPACGCRHCHIRSQKSFAAGKPGGNHHCRRTYGAFAHQVDRLLNDIREIGKVIIMCEANAYLYDEKAAKNACFWKGRPVVAR